MVVNGVGRLVDSTTIKRNTLPQSLPMGRGALCSQIHFSPQIPPLYAETSEAVPLQGHAGETLLTFISEARHRNSGAPPRPKTNTTTRTNPPQWLTLGEGKYKV